MKNLILASVLIYSGFLLAGDDERFKISNLELNTEHSDIGPTFFHEHVVYASTRDKNTFVKRIWETNNLPYFDLQIASQTYGGELEDSKYFKRGFNKKYNEGPASFTKDGKLLAFTQNHYDAKGVKKLNIVTSRYDEKGWTEPHLVAFNNPAYSVGHPSLSKDGSIMFFASDMPGGFGGTDIYMVQKTDEGWGIPQNLGGKINTAGNEMFPYIHKDGMLFFSSNGHTGGLGGLDVYVAHLEGDVEHLEAPVNSSADDFSFIITSDHSSGYFCSNRDGGKGNDDIYYFTNSKKFEIVNYIKGIVTDINGKIMNNTKVYLRDNEGNEIANTTTGTDGAYIFNLEGNRMYQLTTKKDLYFDTEEGFSTIKETQIVKDLKITKDPGISLAGLVTDKVTGKPIPNARVKIIDKSTGAAKKINTDAKGKFISGIENKSLQERLNYEILIEADGYLNISRPYERLLDKEGVYDLAVESDLRMDKINEGVTKLEDLIEVKPIYFDLGKSTIRPDASVELDKIVKVMNENPTLGIELGSHTDSRGTAATNIRLSDERAKASAEYIKSRINNPERIYGKGYGESQIKNRCTDGVKCSESEHEQNRRTEFKIVKI
ncbi:MAG: OmpA family protein [Crocinitomicaceae bacterium]|nr:OmpA family protein [Crocinitomicaceae bacterium]